MAPFLWNPGQKHLPRRRRSVQASGQGIVRAAAARALPRRRPWDSVHGSQSASVANQTYLHQAEVPQGSRRRGQGRRSGEQHCHLRTHRWAMCQGRGTISLNIHWISASAVVYSTWPSLQREKRGSEWCPSVADASAVGSAGPGAAPAPSSWRSKLYRESVLAM
jgi:hypothetical protein